jgi:hypothetical protein
MPITVEFADSVDAKDRKLLRRQERYAAGGPNCPNGHLWSEYAKYNYRGYRFCDVCTREKAEKRRNDSMTYTGSCPHGHAYTRENTMITCTNSKVCIACLRKPEAKPRFVHPSEMDEFLRRASRGDTINEISGEGGPKHRGKGIISRVRLRAACSGDTPEAIELKALFKQNGEAAVGNGRPLFRWSAESIAFPDQSVRDGRDVQGNHRPDQSAVRSRLFHRRNYQQGGQASS